MNTAGLEARIESYMSNLEERLTSEMPTFARACVVAIAEAAPSPNEEQTAIETPSGGRALGLRKADSERISFIRSPGIWIKEAVQDPRTYAIEGLTLSLGFISQLNALTAWSWRNWSKKLGAIEHVSTDSQEYGGTFLWFEYGRDQVDILPLFGNYPLRYKEQLYATVNKSYRPYHMYSAFDKMIFKAEVLSVASTVEF